VYHWRKQVNRKRWVSEALAQTVASVISALRVNFGFSQLVFTRDVVSELLVEGSVDVDLENHGEDDGRDDGDPSPGFEAQLKTDGEDHEKLHQDNGNERPVDNNVPQPATSFYSRNEDEHQLVFVHPRAHPEHDCGGDSDKWSQWSEDHGNGAHE